MRRKSVGLVYAVERRPLAATSTADLMVAIRSESTAATDGVSSNRRTRAVAYIRRLESILEETPDIQVALSDIAQIFHLERTHCCRIFREITGKSFSAWIRGIRIQRAVCVALADSTTLKPEVVRGVDLVFVRELTGGIYFGAKTRTATDASDLCSYSAAEIERVTRVAGRLAQARRRKLTSIDKANVLDTSRLWREVVTRVMKAEFPDVAVEHVGRRGRHAPDPPAGRLRRDRHREHVRRHPHRRSLNAGRFASGCVALCRASPLAYFELFCRYWSMMPAMALFVRLLGPTVPIQDAV